MTGPKTSAPTPWPDAGLGAGSHDGQNGIAPAIRGPGRLLRSGAMAHFMVQSSMCPGVVAFVHIGILGMVMAGAAIAVDFGGVILAIIAS